MGTPSFSLYDALLHGQLESLLKRWRSEGVTIREIAERITERLPEGESVSHASVNRWCKAKKIPAAKRRAA